MLPNRMQIVLAAAHLLISADFMFHSGLQLITIAPLNRWKNAESNQQPTRFSVSAMRRGCSSHRIHPDLLIVATISGYYLRFRRVWIKRYFIAAEVRG
ncbi:hypothetical protein F4808DRAFT_440730 [Astrocystis sublimbata]|nr:hypothetical protein F4808DRAFT_440730 [Astrocystis sublimbata]